MQIITFFRVIYNSDGMEGKGHTVRTPVVFLGEEAAKDFVTSDHYKKHAPMNHLPKRSSCSHCYEKDTIAVYDSFNDFNDKSQAKQDEITYAVGKLSAEDIALLGIDVDAIRESAKV